VTIVRVGTTQKYSNNWESIFKGKKGAKATAASSKKAAPKKSSKKAAGKKAAKKK